MGDDDTRIVTLMWAAQTGKTQTMSNGMGYHIAHKPSSQMMMQPSQGDSKTWLETKFNPMVEASPTLQDRIAKPRGREGVNNQNMKSYAGGFLMLAWAGSPKTMRGRSAPIINCDEIDGYDSTSEGDPIGLVWQRAATFGDNRKLILTSTPTIKGESRIEDYFEMGDQRHYFIPCHACDEYQRLIWDNVVWNTDKDGTHRPKTARYVCTHCQAEINDSQKVIALQSGEWRASQEFNGHASFHLNELYSPFRRFSDIVESFLEKKRTGSLQTFINVSLAETWEDKVEKQDFSVLYNRREHYKTNDIGIRLIPAGVKVLTAWADVQDDRLEVGVTGWGEAEQSWEIDYFILEGDPAKQGIWDRLADVFRRTYEGEAGGIYDIKLCGVDSGGHYTSEVYKFCKKFGAFNCIPTKGASQKAKAIVTLPRKSNEFGVYLTYVGTDTAKELIYQRYKNVEPGAGYMHFPVADFTDEEYFKQATAEYRKIKFKDGHRHYVWEKSSSQRNEVLDTKVGNLAMVRMLQMRGHRLTDDHYRVDKVDKPVITSNSSFINNKPGWLQR